jgi:hypothetical protein
MLSKGDVVDDADDDDEVRTSGSQKRTTATLSTEEFCLRTQNIALTSYQQRGMGQEKMVNTIHIDGPSWVSAPSWTSIPQCGVYQTDTIILLLKKPIFSFMSIQYMCKFIP